MMPDGVDSDGYLRVKKPDIDNSPVFLINDERQVLPGEKFSVKKAYPKKARLYNAYGYSTNVNTAGTRSGSWELYASNQGMILFSTYTTDPDRGTFALVFFSNDLNTVRPIQMPSSAIAYSMNNTEVDYTFSSDTPIPVSSQFDGTTLTEDTLLRFFFDEDILAGNYICFPSSSLSVSVSESYDPEGELYIAALDPTAEDWYQKYQHGFLLSSAGTATVNGEYYQYGTYGEHPYYYQSANNMYAYVVEMDISIPPFEQNVWAISQTLGDTDTSNFFYYSVLTDPETELYNLTWTSGSLGANPVPQSSELFPLYSDIFPWWTGSKQKVQSGGWWSYFIDDVGDYSAPNHLLYIKTPNNLPSGIRSFIIGLSVSLGSPPPVPSWSMSGSFLRPIVVPPDARIFL
jgi:hypothetical protein